MSASQKISKPVVKRGRPFGSNAKDTRKRLIAAAEKHFNSSAYADVSMAKVAKTAGITGAAIYNYFDSKDDLFLETVKSRMQNYNRAINAAVAGDDTWKEKYNRLLEAVTPLTGSASRFPMIASVVINRLQHEPEKFQEIRDEREESAKIFRMLMVEAVECGDLPKDTNTTIAGDLLMAITAGALNTVSFYNPSLDNMGPIIDSVKTLLGTKN